MTLLQHIFNETKENQETEKLTKMCNDDARIKIFCKFLVCMYLCLGHTKFFLFVLDFGTIAWIPRFHNTNSQSSVAVLAVTISGFWYQILLLYWSL